MLVRSVGQEDSLEKETATRFGILAWETMHRGAWQATAHRITQSDTTESLSLSTNLGYFYILTVSFN